MGNGIDIRFIKELRALKKEAQGNIKWLNRKLEGGHWSKDFEQNAKNLLDVYQDQVETADSMIRDELRK